MTEPVLTVAGLTCRFGPRPVVSDFGLRLARGEVVGLIGPNGAGKSTVLNAISGFHRDWSGRVELLGQEIGGLPGWKRARRGMGRSFQLDRAFWQLGLLDAAFAAIVPGQRAGVASAALDLASGRTRRWRQAARKVLARLDVGAEDKPVAELSGGQLRAFSLELLAERRPQVLLLDEPFAGLSPDRKRRLRSELLRIEEASEQAVLLVDHDLDQVRQVCQRVLVMDAGRVVVSGPPSAIFGDPKVLSSYLGRGSDHG